MSREALQATTGSPSATETRSAANKRSEPAAKRVPQASGTRAVKEASLVARQLEPSGRRLRRYAFEFASEKEACSESLSRRRQRSGRPAVRSRADARLHSSGVVSPSWRRNNATNGRREAKGASGGEVRTAAGGTARRRCSRSSGASDCGTSSAASAKTGTVEQSEARQSVVRSERYYARVRAHACHARAEAEASTVEVRQTKSVLTASLCAFAGSVLRIAPQQCRNGSAPRRCAHR